jgi:hemoglobin
MATTEVHDWMYQSVGGDAGLTVLVDNFYARLWSDPDLKKYFEGIDKDALKKHQRMFLTFALGGGQDAYTGRPLASAHQTLNITNDAFDSVAYHLRLTLEELDVDRGIISIVMGYVEGTRSQVVFA